MRIRTGSIRHPPHTMYTLTNTFPLWLHSSRAQLRKEGHVVCAFCGFYLDVAGVGLHRWRM